jgi:uncharacterized protein (TIGR00106 family)
MLADLSIIPVGGDTHTSDLLAEILSTIDSSGIAYQLTPTTTCLEGSWQEIMAVTQRCHEIARRDHDHIVTQLRIEDDANAGRKLRRNIESVEQKAGQELRTTPRSRAAAKGPDVVGRGRKPARTRAKVTAR